MKTLYNLSDCLGAGDDDDDDDDDSDDDGDDRDDDDDDGDDGDDRDDDDGGDGDDDRDDGVDDDDAATAGVVAVGIKHATMMLLSAVCVNIPLIVGDIAVTPATDTTGTLYRCRLATF